MKCAECGKQMRWVGDSEDFLDERTYSLYECYECEIELFKYWKVEGEL